MRKPSQRSPRNQTQRPRAAARFIRNRLTWRAAFERSPIFDFHVSSRPLGRDTWIVSLDGEIDAHAAPRLAEELESLAADGAREIVVHLGGIELIDSTALGVLLRARDTLKQSGGDIVLVTNDGRMLRLFEVTGLDRTFRIESSLSEAVESVEGAEVPA